MNQPPLGREKSIAPSSLKQSESTKGQCNITCCSIISKNNCFSGLNNVQYSLESHLKFPLHSYNCPEARHSPGHRGHQKYHTSETDNAVGGLDGGSPRKKKRKKKLHMNNWSSCASSRVRCQDACPLKLHAEDFWGILYNALS